MTCCIGKGTDVNVSFQVHTGHHAASINEPEADLPGEGNILLVDDEQSIVEVDRKILEELDYTMPAMTGAELASKVLEFRPQIPIVLCSGYSSNISEEQAKQLGAKFFVFKPLVKREIASLVREALVGQ